MKNMKEFKPILKYFKKYKFMLIVSAIIIFATNLNYIFTGYLNGAAIEKVIGGQIKASLTYLVIYFVLNIVLELVSKIVDFSLGKIQIKVSRNISYDTYGKVMCMPAYAFEEMSSGEIINRLTSDTEIIIGSMERLLNVVSRVLSSLIILIYIFINSWIIGLEILFFLIIYFFIVKYFTKKLRDYHKDVTKKGDECTSLVTESVRGVREIKVLGIVKNIYKNIGNLIKEQYYLIVKENKESRNYDIISNILKMTLECGTFITCAILVYYGQITVTFFVAMTYYIYRYTWVVENITDLSKTYEKLVVSLSRINEILNNKLYEDVKYGTKTLDNVQGVLEFKDVTFNYKNDEQIFNKFNIKFTPNKKIAIVGSSGEGKTTLFNLITRLFDPIDGSICLDGIDIRDLTEESLRQNISIIRQEPFIFNRTIKENIELINPKVSIEEIRKYCKLAYIDDYIMSLPKGYDTILGEGGVNLSGGQKQRLSIARTLLKNSKVVLFDEATSALDNESQSFIKNSIDNLSKNHTVLIVAHRLSTIIDADIIYVIQKGKLVAEGTHAQLMEDCSFYKKLYTSESIVK